MLINADKVTQWKKDVQASVDMYNAWFLQFAPITYRQSRVSATAEVKETFRLMQDLRDINHKSLRAAPEVLTTLRMCTAPPLARDRLVGFSSTKKHLILSLERGKLPPKMHEKELEASLKRICDTIVSLLDMDIFPWLTSNTPPQDEDRARAATIVADRLTGAVYDPVIRNVQEIRQLEKIQSYLENLGYELRNPVPGSDPRDIKQGTFCFRYNITANLGNRTVSIPIDVLIQPKELRKDKMSILIECKSAGDFTNPNKRRKEEAAKVRQLKETFGDETTLYLFLCGYFDTGYLGYEAAEGLDWIWEHRIDDLMKLGL